MTSIGLLLNPYRYGLLALDSFDRADNASSLGNADTGQTWTAHGGTWGISGNKCVPATAAAYNAASLDAGALLATVEVTITNSGVGGVDCGIAGRVIDNTGYVFLDVSKSASTIVSRTFQKTAGVAGGAFVALTSSQLISNNLTDTMQIRLVFYTAATGESFANTPTLGGWTSLGTFSGLNAGLQTPTRYGLVGNNATAARFDNFTVRSS